MKKHVLLAAVVLVLPLVLTGCGPSGQKSSESTPTVSYIPGTYLGSGEGYCGTMTVSVEVDVSRITKVTIKQSNEVGIGEKAETLLCDAVVDRNSTHVDAVTGATVTSSGFLNAVEDALSQAQK